MRGVLTVIAVWAAGGAAADPVARFLNVAIDQCLGRMERFQPPEPLGLSFLRTVEQQDGPPLRLWVHQRDRVVMALDGPPGAPQRCVAGLRAADGAAERRAFDALRAWSERAVTEGGYVRLETRFAGGGLTMRLETDGWREPRLQVVIVKGAGLDFEFQVIETDLES